MWLRPARSPFASDYVTPQVLTREGIQTVVRAFVEAAGRARKAGFRVIEIHAAHGYLISEFLSPLANHRTDAYGGSFENRIRLLLEVVSAVRGSWPAGAPLLVRISATDWAEGGWTLDESVELAKRLKNSGVDLVDCSSGGNVPPAQIPAGPGYQTPFAERIRRESNILTGAVGMITAPSQADHIIRTGQADVTIPGSGRMTTHFSEQGTAAGRGSPHSITDSGRLSLPMAWPLGEIYE